MIKDNKDFDALITEWGCIGWEATSIILLMFNLYKYSQPVILTSNNITQSMLVL